MALLAHAKPVSNINEKFLGPETHAKGDTIVSGTGQKKKIGT